MDALAVNQIVSGSGMVLVGVLAAVASIFIIHWCWRRWGVPEEAPPAFQEAHAMEFQESEPFYEEGDNA